MTTKTARTLQADRHDGECAYDILADGSIVISVHHYNGWINVHVFTPTGRTVLRRFRPNRMVKVQHPTRTTDAAWKAMHRYDDHDGDGSGAESAYGCTHCH